MSKHVGSSEDRGVLSVRIHSHVLVFPANIGRVRWGSPCPKGRCSLYFPVGHMLQLVSDVFIAPVGHALHVIVREETRMAPPTHEQLRPSEIP